ncbi:lysophospholipid acyltransferase family protein [Streptomyces sp. DSM 44938]|uniref:Lysophospholipid acyltransferase family protein n=1 Tax=Streptomyces litchfieldiae TaxID=3075543 RepID=A0ABU2MVK7_9ACTN|nr:lysophospholipid acyltransferase family protein [Streptomyces sp. DSM 44938]MDT0345526.1 lysophospholipid acyltransferase family protein [Streptomyces sp. DSM 44938]
MTRPGARGAVAGRRLACGVIHTVWRPRVLGAWRVPATGPVILAVNHTHNVDGPVLMGTAPRPVHFLIKKEAFTGPLGTFLRGMGQIRVDRAGADRAAIGSALAVLAAGGVLGIFPEGTRTTGDFAALRAGLAYFALRSGAPVVPVAVLGSGERPGRVIAALPPLRGRIDVVFGDPFTVGGGRRTGAALDAATDRLRQRLTAHLKDARRHTRRASDT